MVSLRKGTDKGCCSWDEVIGIKGASKGFGFSGDGGKRVWSEVQRVLAKHVVVVRMKGADIGVVLPGMGWGNRVWSEGRRVPAKRFS